MALASTLSAPCSLLPHAPQAPTNHSLPAMEGSSPSLFGSVSEDDASPLLAAALQTSRSPLSPVLGRWGAHGSPMDRPPICYRLSARPPIGRRRCCPSAILNTPLTNLSSHPAPSSPVKERRLPCSGSTSSSLERNSRVFDWVSSAAHQVAGEIIIEGG